MLRNLLAMAAVFLVGGLVAAQPAPKKPDPNALVTKVYDLKPILGEKGKANGFADTDAKKLLRDLYMPLGKGKANGFADMDAVFKVIFDSLPELRDLNPGADGPQLVERDNGKLEVRAAAKTHEELKDLIEAMTRLVDIAVDVKATVYEFDPATFDKLVKALPKDGRGKPGSPVLYATGEESEDEALAGGLEKALAEVNKILKTGRQVQNSTARFVNGVEATFAARQSVLTFHNHVVNQKPEGPPQFVKEGFKLVGLPVVSVDRRFVRMKLTEQSVVVTRMKKVDVGEVVDKQNLVIQSPELEDLGTSGSAVVADGGTAIFRLAYAPKDKVWVVVLHPSIFIQAEEDELKKQEKK
jgi:hypothetical protein